MFGGRILGAHVWTCVRLHLSCCSQLGMRFLWLRRLMKTDGGGRGGLEKCGSHCGFGLSLFFV